MSGKGNYVIHGIVRYSGRDGSKFRAPLKSLENSLHRVFTLSNSRVRLRFTVHYAKDSMNEKYGMVLPSLLLHSSECRDCKSRKLHNSLNPRVAAGDGPIENCNLCHRIYGPIG